MHTQSFYSIVLLHQSRGDWIVENNDNLVTNNPTKTTRGFISSFVSVVTSVTVSTWCWNISTASITTDRKSRGDDGKDSHRMEGCLCCSVTAWEQRMTVDTAQWNVSTYPSIHKDKQLHMKPAGSIQLLFLTNKTLLQWMNTAAQLVKFHKG